ncbi:hypothetical protein B9Z55_007462 [Caenorhabditis nigoni]|uniref:G-protein coupled receptors family 1 profile domain-containing protein n=1 Tax=Caenorhabditis nigoni TaxID=1611254 RepID=A0A2G5VA42_9PELO|nr:hypothetical protein B9Z55_007462 [Caenorhabditis nigoni]
MDDGTPLVLDHNSRTRQNFEKLLTPFDLKLKTTVRQLLPVCYIWLKNSATTKFVILNTITYVISSFPAGMFYLTYSFFPLWCLDGECYNFLQVFDFLTSFITLTHFPICLAMSTQYRSTVAGLLKFKKSSDVTMGNLELEIENVERFSIFSDSYHYVVFQWIYYSVLDDVRRCDAFLGLAMASIRTFVLKFPMRSSTTTKFVFLNTIAYVISALPTGIVYILHFVLPKWCLEVQCYDYPDALTMLTSLMTLTHFPICLAMSTQYRSTVLGLLRIKIEPRTTVGGLESEKGKV